jgi:hypothetical protein
MAKAGTSRAKRVREKVQMRAERPRQTEEEREALRIHRMLIKMGEIPEDSPVGWIESYRADTWGLPDQPEDS